MAPRIKWTQVEVLDVTGTQVTVGSPNEFGTMTELVLDPPHVQPHFLPDVGSQARLLLVGPVPFLYPDTIAEDAITAREIVADAITALLVQGATIQTAESGQRIVLDLDGLRMLNDDEETTVSLDTVTGGALVTGVFQTATSGSRMVAYQNELGRQIIDLFSTDPESSPCRITLLQDAFGLSPRLLLQSNPDTALGSYIVLSLTDGVTLDAYYYRVDVRPDSIYIGNTTESEYGAYIQIVDNTISFQQASGPMMTINDTGVRIAGDTGLPYSVGTRNVAADAITATAVTRLNQLITALQEMNIVGTP